ncbi:HDOD domain-containing protein [Deferribacteraceae bacterium V6Fe1]|nr:HDOD domain-containing protein [Deferribacteraceae bacterium V6Fe1]
MYQVYFEGDNQTFLDIYRHLNDKISFVQDAGTADIILLEVKVADDIRKLDGLKDSKVFVILDKPDREIILKLKQYKIAGILSKPIKQDILLEKMQSFGINSDSQELLKYETLKAKIIAKATSISPLPKVARELIAMSSKENVEINDIVAKIKTDQGVASKVLKIINSPFYGMRREITSIERATIYLGLGTVKNIAISLSTAEMFNKNFSLYGTSGQKMWEHSFITARLCEEIANLSKQKLDSDALYLAGLFHDIGKAILVDFIYEKVTGAADEKRQLGLNHIDVAMIILKKWNIAEQIIFWVKNHHEFSPEINSAVLYFANIIANDPEMIRECSEDISKIIGVDKELFVKKIEDFLSEEEG